MRFNLAAWFIFSPTTQKLLILDDYTLVPYFSLKPGALTLYELPEPYRYGGNSHLGFKNLDDNKNKYGELSQHSTKRLRKTIDYMLYLSDEKKINGTKIISKSNIETIELEKGVKYEKNVNYKLTFVTLTLPSTQVHSDNEIKSKCLNHFLTVLRTKYNVDLYIWKAEKQANNNIHFHILTNKFIPYIEIRKNWNTIINKLGYVDEYQKKMQEYFKNGFRLSENKNDKRTEAKQREAFLNGLKCNFSDPNSTDIHALYKIKNVAAYISKYLSKEVTKTDRIIKIDSIKYQLSDINKQYDNLSLEKNQFITFSDEYKQLSKRINTLELQEFELQKQLQNLKSQGVEGRIWGCSSILSACKNYTELCPPWQVPDIEEIVKKNTGIYTNEIGSRKVVTYTFEMSTATHLNEILKKHIFNQINQKEKFKLLTS